MTGDAKDGTVLGFFSRGFISVPGMAGVSTAGAEIRRGEEVGFDLEFWWDLGLLGVLVLADGDDGCQGDVDFPVRCEAKDDSTHERLVSSGEGEGMGSDL